jgi:hypothetical protein
MVMGELVAQFAPIESIDSRMHINCIIAEEPGLSLITALSPLIMIERRDRPTY